MKSVEEIKARIQDFEKRLELLEQYLNMKKNERDWHGVEDAASDIRDTQAAIEALQWVVE